MREGSIPAPLVRRPADSAWAMAATGRAYLVYTMTGEAVDFDLAGDQGDFHLAWLDSASGELRAAGSVTAGKIVELHGVIAAHY